MEAQKLDSTAWWNDPNNLKIFVQCWQQIAEICKDRDQVIWFNLMNEPTDWNTVHSQPSYAPKLPEFLQAATDAIRKIDKTHPILIEPGPGMLCWGFRGFPLIKDDYQPVIYSVHMYQPVEYTHQGVNGVKIHPWPSEFTDRDVLGRWDKKALEKELAPAIEFQKKHNVRIYVGEFSAPRWAPGAAQYLQDCIDIFEKYGWDWNYHSFEEAGIWRLDESDEVALFDKDGKYVRTGLAEAGSGLQYHPYGAALPEGVTITPEKKPEGLTQRGRVIKAGLDRNSLVRKLLVVGNSITQHGPSEPLNWKYDCGMAATSKDNDFVHLLYKELCAFQPTHKPALQIAHLTNEAAMTGYDALLPCDADVIVIELGDNYRGAANVEELQKPYEQLIRALKGDRKCQVFCTSAWGRDDLSPFFRDAAKNCGATFVDLRPLAADPKNFAAAEGNFTHSGVNWHPGNRGMKAIAETLWKTMRPKLVAARR